MGGAPRPGSPQSRKRKGLVSGRRGRLVLPLLGARGSLTRIWRLIVVVGVEVSEVGVGVGFPGKLRVEVLVPLLQHQVVFVESLEDGEQRAQWWGRS